MNNVSRIPIYDVSIDDNENLGLFGISYVESPAIMEEMVAFKNEEIKVYLVSNEKHEIVSPVLIPNQLIFRVYDGMPCYIRFSEETIRKAAERYMIKGYFNNWTFEHENIDDDIKNRIQPNIFTKRLWIIDDEKTDDANTKYGYNLPKGTLMVHAKVNNRKIWNLIKEGKIRGLSMEAILKFKSTSKALEISYSKEMDNKFDFTEEKMNLFQKFVAFLNEVSQEADGVASEAKKDETNSGEVTLKYFLDDEHYLEVDGEGFVRDENYELVAEGEYRLADTSILVVDENNKFVGTKALDENAGDEQVEAPITEGFSEEKLEEETKEDEKENNSNDGESEPEVVENSGEVDSEGSEEVGSDSDEKVEQLSEEKPLVNVLPYEINGQECLLSEEVINYIEELKKSKLEVEEKLTKMADETPSAQPIGAVVKESNVEMTPMDRMNARFEALERFKEWRKNRY